jgi:serine/threonine protein kinase
MQLAPEVGIHDTMEAGAGSSAGNSSAMGMDENFTVEHLDREEGQFLISKKVLGEGATSIVKLAWSKALNKRCAVKIIAKYKLNEKSHRNLRRELEIHKFLSKTGSPTICNLIDIAESNQHYFIFLEYLEGGDLISYIEKEGKLAEPVAKTIMKRALESIQFIHSNSVVHRDIKAENFLLEFDDKQIITGVKLTDFGLADWLGPEKSFSTPCGSPCYTGTTLSPQYHETRGQLHIPSIINESRNSEKATPIIHVCWCVPSLL